MVKNAAGVVLCGGFSSRMGKDKPQLFISGQTLLSRAVETLAGCVPHVIVCARPGQTLPLLSPDVLRLDDEHPGGGPLRALVQPLRTAEAMGLSDAVVLGVDLPFFTAGMAELLLDSLRPGDLAAVPISAGHPQMLAAAYRVAAAPAAEALIREGGQSMKALLARVPHRLVSPAEYAHLDPAGRVFWNVNTPEGYERLLREIATEPG